MILRRLRPEIATGLIIAAGALAGLMILPQLTQIVDGITQLAASGGVQTSYTAQLMKIGGISLLMDFAAQTCRDANEDGLALKVELAGRVMLIGLSLPVMQKLLAQIMSLSL